MCGIAGEFYKNKSVIGAKRMEESIGYRGPDMRGKERLLCTGGVFELFHSRLSIIDLSNAGIQPMSNSRFVITFNGEIYNYLHLRKRYLSDVAFMGSTDTEVLLHLWARLGRKCVPLLNGMFAFFIWDKVKEEGFLVRDSAGIKPLFYQITSASFSFSSDVSAYAKSSLKIESLQYFVRDGHFTGNSTAYNSVYKVQPGEIIRFDSKSFFTTKDIWYERGSECIDMPKSYYERKQNLNLLINQSVASQTVSDVKVGCFLSGGYDSTAVVSSLVEQGFGGNIEAYTLGFEEKEFDESVRASAIADHLGVKHNITKVGISDLKEVVVDHFMNLSYPDGDSSIIPTKYLCHQVSKDVKVILSADGGDELFAGYTRFQDYLATIHRLKVFTPIYQYLPAIKSISSFRKLNKLFDVSDSLHGDSTDFVMAYTAHFTNHELKNIFNNFRQREVYDSPSLPTLKLLCESEFNEYLINDVLRKVDLATMHNSIEGRVPLLDPDLVDFAFALPDGDKLVNGKGKWILKDLVHDKIPSQIMDFPKTGFAIPINSWLQGELLEMSMDILSSNQSAVNEVFNKEYVEILKRQIQSSHFSDRDGRLWNLLNAIRFIS